MVDRKIGSVPPPSELVADRFWQLHTHPKGFWTFEEVYRHWSARDLKEVQTEGRVRALAMNGNDFSCIF
jgi:hypothetical protein